MISINFKLKQKLQCIFNNIEELAKKLKKNKHFKINKKHVLEHNLVFQMKIY